VPCVCDEPERGICKEESVLIEATGN
jgi:hypothetical protein